MSEPDSIGAGRRHGARLPSGVASGALGLALAILALPGIPGPARGAVFGGWEGDGLHQGYAYVAFGRRWPDPAPLGFGARLQASDLYYRFEEAGGETRVWSPGATLLAGPSAAGALGSTTLLAGLDLRRERRERPSGTTVEDQAALQLQWEASPALGPRMRSFALAQYSFASDYTYALASLGRQLTNFEWTGPSTLVMGLEAAGQGNRESDGWQAGGYAECTLTRARLSLSIHSGYKSAGSPGSARTGTYYAGLGAYLSR